MSLTTPYRKVKAVRVIVALTNGQVIEGSINIGFEERVSDFLAMPDRPWVPVFGIGDAGAVVIVNKLHIVSVEPKD